MKKTRLLYAFLSGLALCVFSAATGSEEKPSSAREFGLVRELNP